MRRFLSVFVLMAGLVTAGGARAAIVVTIAPSGNDVVATSAGTINSGVCTSTQDAAIGQGGIAPMIRTLIFGAPQSLATRCITTITSPAVFGSGGTTFSSSSSGAPLLLGTNLFFGPRNFNSSTSFSSTMTFAGNTLAGMGLTLGSYIFTLTNGPTSDTVTININSSAPNPPVPPQPIPTLSEWAQIVMMLIMIATAGFYGWRMKQQ